MAKKASTPVVPKVSVILTTHDGYDDRLGRAVQSVLDQSFKDFELVVVKDGGKSRKVFLDSFKDPRIVYHHRKENFGQHTRPKNDGIKAAKADYICFLDGDNTYRKDHIQALWKDHERNPWAAVVYGDRMVVYEDGKKPSLPGVSSEFSLSLLGKQNYIDTGDVLVNKAAMMDVGGWDESLEFFADWNLWVRMAKAGYMFKHLKLIISDYYVHTTNNVRKAGKLDEKGYLRWHNDYIQNPYIWAKKTLFGDRPSPRVAIYTLCYDRLNTTKETFETMRKNTKYPFDHFVLDQGSKDDTRKWLKENEKKMNLTIELSDTNLGISKGSNLLLDKIREAGGYSLIIKVDNDCGFITERWLERMVDVFQHGRKFLLSPYPEGLIDNPGGAPRVKDGFIDKEYVGIVDHIGGLCVAAPAEAYEGFRWDDDDFLHGEQDFIFSQEMRMRGYILIYLENIKVEHLFNTSFSDSGKQLAKKEEKSYRERRQIEKVTRYES